MRIIKISRSHISKKILIEISNALQRGEVIVFPTDTAYGLAADPTNIRAVGKIFKVKGRSKNKPLPLIAENFVEVKKRCILSTAIERLAQKHWPGPLTLVLPLKTEWKKKIHAQGKEKTVAIRVPKSAWARALASANGGIITSTSANISGEETTYNPRDIRRSFLHRKYQPDIFLDAGILKKRLPSTIARIHQGKIEILREGSVKFSARGGSASGGKSNIVRSLSRTTLM